MLQHQVGITFCRDRLDLGVAPNDYGIDWRCRRKAGLGRALVNKGTGHVLSAGGDPVYGLLVAIFRRQRRGSRRF